eukprot:scaffold104194_cov32-Tisochrysis_lutea.AAC.3
MRPLRPLPRAEKYTECRCQARAALVVRTPSRVAHLGSRAPPTGLSQAPHSGRCPNPAQGRPPSPGVVVLLRESKQDRSLAVHLAGTATCRDRPNRRLRRVQRSEKDY